MPILPVAVNRRFTMLRVTILLFVSIAFLGGAADAADRARALAVADSLANLWQDDPETLPSFDSTATLDEYLLIAMKRNPGLKSAYYRWIADLSTSGYAGSLPDPMLTYGYFMENVETRVGPQEQRFSLRQSFPWFGTLGAKEDIAFARSQASYRKFEAARLLLFFRVKAAFYEYYYLGRELQITRDNFDLLKFWESIAQSKYRVGLRQHPDLIKTQVELGKLEERVHSLREKQAPAATRLRALLNLPEEVAIPVPLTISVVEAELMEDSVMAVIARNNPGLRALQHRVESAQAGVRLAGKQALPNFSIGIDYIQTGAAGNPDMLDSGKDPWIIAAGISLPIWFGKNKARKEEAAARRRAAEYDLHDSENNIAAAAEQVLFEYTDALRKTRLYRDGLVPKARQSLNAGYAAYRAGETDFLNLLDAQRQLLDFQLTVARARVQLATKRAQLEMLGGTELDAYERK